MKRQLAFILARAQTPIDWVQELSEDEDETDPVEMPEDLLECLSNTKLSAHFKAFGKEVGAEEAKTLEEVYKSHLEPARRFIPPALLVLCLSIDQPFIKARRLLSIRHAPILLEPL
jgi:hypothetical protein